MSREINEESVVNDILTLINEDGQKDRVIDAITSKLIEKNLNKDFVGWFTQHTFFNEEDESNYLIHNNTGVNPLVAFSIVKDWYLHLYGNIIQSEQGIELDEIIHDYLYEGKEPDLYKKLLNINV